jgi:ribosome-associated protein
MNQNETLAIPESDLTFSFSRSGGPGGQNVNKVSTRVMLKFDLENTKSLTEEQKEKVREALSTRISKDGKILVICQKHRSQSANREEAVLRLKRLVSGALVDQKDRIETKIPRRQREKRLQEKKRKALIKRERSKSGLQDEF